MGRNNNAARAQPRRVELDMSAIMNMDQKNSLQLLLNSILEDMQKELRDVFDNLGDGYDESEEGIKAPKITCCSIHNPRSAKYQDLSSDKGNTTENHSQAPRKTLSTGAPAAPPTIPRSMEEAIQLSGKTMKETRISSLSDLKRDALGAFGKWRANVQRKVGDMIIRGGGSAGLPAGQGPQQPTSAIRRPTRIPPEQGAKRINGERNPQISIMPSRNNMLLFVICP